MTKLAAARRKSGFRLREIAEKLCITAQTVQQQEKRGIRSIRTAQRYATVLGCDWRELFDDAPAYARRDRKSN